MSLETYLRNFLQINTIKDDNYSRLLHKPLFLVHLLGGEIRMEESDHLNRVKVFGLPEMKVGHLETTALYAGFEHGLAGKEQVTAIADIRYTQDELLFNAGYAAAKAFINALKLKKEPAI